jgi:hypothetical protein
MNLVNEQKSLCELLHRVYETSSALALAQCDPLLEVRVLLPGLGAETSALNPKVQSLVIADACKFVDSCPFLYLKMPQ